MRTVFRNLVAAAILLIAGIGVAAAGDTGPFLGTWNLSVAKSRFGPGPALKSAQRVYTVAGDALDLVITGVAPDGTPFTRHSVFKLDGRDYPITSLGDFDTMSVKRVDAYHFEMTMKNAGKVVANMDGDVFPRRQGIHAGGQGDLHGWRTDVVNVRFRKTVIAAE